MVEGSYLYELLLQIGQYQKQNDWKGGGFMFIFINPLALKKELLLALAVKTSNHFLLVFNWKKQFNHYSIKIIKWSNKTIQGFFKQLIFQYQQLQGCSSSCR